MVSCQPPAGSTTRRATLPAVQQPRVAETGSTGPVSGAQSAFRGRVASTSSTTSTRGPEPAYTDGHFRFIAKVLLRKGLPWVAIREVLGSLNLNWQGNLRNWGRVTLELAVKQDATKLLSMATLQGNANIVQYAVRHKADPNAKMGIVMITALERHDERFVSLLLELNAAADPRGFGSRELISACVDGRVGMVKILVDRVKLGGDAPFALIPSSSSPYLWHPLLCKGPHKRTVGEDALLAAVSMNHIEIAEILLEKGVPASTEQNLALRWAAGRGYLCMVQLLLKHNADIRASFDEPLRAACQCGHIDVVELLLAAGADPTARDGQSLVLAASFGYLGIVEILMEKIVDVGVRSQALVAAASGGHSSTASYLLHHGQADPNVDDSSPLKCAARNRNVELVKELLLCGAVATSARTPALTGAARRGFSDVVEVLLREGKCSPTDHKMEAFAAAAEEGHVDILLQMLEVVTDESQVCEAIAIALLSSGKALKAVFNALLRVVQARRIRIASVTECLQRVEAPVQLSPNMRQPRSQAVALTREDVLEFMMSISGDML